MHIYNVRYCIYAKEQQKPRSDESIQYKYKAINKYYATCYAIYLLCALCFNFEYKNPT
jgi:hypothetical protein